MTARADQLRQAMTERVLVADGAMGTMLQAADPSLDDFQGYEGCNEILNVTRPDVVRSVHDAYFEVGVDAVETNTFGANWANLGEYDIADRIYELAEAGARIAAEAADHWSTPEKPRFVIGSVGPGTKLPSLLHAPYSTLRDAYAEQTRGLVDGGADAVLIETSQDLLQAKAAVVGARRAMTAAGVSLPVFVQVTVETTGTMLMGSEIGAALTALEPLGIDAIGLNCATGPAEMSEHLRHLSRHSTVPVTCMPNAGLPMLTKDGASYPLTPEELAAAHTQFVAEFGLTLVGGCCGTTPEHLARVVEAVGGRPLTTRRPRPEHGVASLYSAVPVPAGRVLPHDRRADERQRLQGVPRRHDRGAVGLLRGDRTRPDARRGAPAGRLRRLRRPRRRAGHARGDQPVRDVEHVAHRAGLDRAPGRRGRVWRCSAAAR